MGEVTSCGICSWSQLEMILDLGKQPLAEAMGHGERYPLALLRCPNCSLVQLSYAVDQREVFREDHPYASGNTAALRQHFSTLALEWLGELKLDDLVVDIGANDGTLLTYFAGHGVRRLAVEPTHQADKCRDKRITTHQGFFTAELASTLVAIHGPAALITATNVLAHVPDPHDFMTGVKILLAPDGAFLTENHEWASIANGLQIDTIYHEHLRYYSVASLSRLLEMHGFSVISSIPVRTHGGSFRVVAEKLEPGLQMRTDLAMTHLRTLLHRLTADGSLIYGIGAATRATPLIHKAGIANYITCVCEVSASEKIGRTMPGTAIPVRDEAVLTEDQPAYALLFAWHLADSLLPQLRQKGFEGSVIIPLPAPKVVSVR